MGAYCVTHGKVEEWAAQYDGEPFHALLCDPPYHLTDPSGRTNKGFMGKDWDGGDVVFRPETWAALAQHLHPGAFGMAFAGSRGWHRMAVAIEDAGLIIHPTIFLWAYGSGFPKATRIDTQVDRRAGAARAVVGQRKHAPKFAAAELGYREKDNGYNSRERESFDLTAPATELAAAWQGHRYGLQALKPAVEPIVVFQKPYQGRPVDDITATGAGALWIDGGRVGQAREERLLRHGATTGAGLGYHGAEPQTVIEGGAGRWPANLVLSHLPTCDADGCDAGCAVAALAAQSGERPSGMMRAGTQRSTGGGYHGNMPPTISGDTYGDTGTAARFFHAAAYALNQLEAADALAYVAKASSAEREAGLDPVQVALVRELYGDDLSDFDETTVDDGRETPIDNPYLRGETTRRNIHPTIKPLTLARHLATLLLPPAAYAPGRRLLVPFSGTGSEMIGGLLAGWDHISGVELDAQHVAIARARLRYWEQQRHRFDQGQPISVKAPRKGSAGQHSLFDQEEAA